MNWLPKREKLDPKQASTIFLRPEGPRFCSRRLQKRMPGLRGFSGRSLKNMRSFYEAWSMLEPNSAIQIAELPKDTETAGLVAQTGGMGDSAIQIAEIRQLELTNLPNFPLAEFLSIGFTHHIMQDFRQPMGVATYKTADEIDPDLLKALPPKEELERLLEPEGNGQ